MTTRADRTIHALDLTRALLAEAQRNGDHKLTRQLQSDVGRWMRQAAAEFPDLKTPLTLPPASVYGPG